MLILQRREQQALLIGDDVRVVVLKTDGGGVRLGIEAPAEVTILREEIVDQVRAENLIASASARHLEAARRSAEASGPANRPGSADREDPAGGADLDGRGDDGA